MKKKTISIYLTIILSLGMILHAQAQDSARHKAQDGDRHEVLERRIVGLSPGIFAFIGYSTSNFGVIATKNGYILIDAGDNIAGNSEALKEIKKRIPGVLQGIILTHSHPDHRSGAEPFLETASDNVPIWGASNFGSEGKAVKGLEKVTADRFSKQFGVGIPDSLYTQNSLVPRFQGFKSGALLNPNQRTQSGKTEINIDGQQIELHSVPTETQDHLAIWLPKEKVLFSGDAIYGCFPNLYPIRGGAYRDVEQWASGIRRLMEFQPKAIMLGHRDAITDSAIITEMFADHATAIEYVFNETIKGMNEGKSSDELARDIHLPQELAEKDYLGEYHGALSWGVREIYAAKLGWFDGNPTQLVPLTPEEKAKHISRLAGGPKKLLHEAKKALKKEDYKWALMLADCLIELGIKKEAYSIKSKALMEISRDVLPITGKNYLIRSAMDLKRASENN